jgi:hypothetical protein
MTPSQLIAFLNSLCLGDVGSLGAKLEEAGAACSQLGQSELASHLGEARVALSGGDVKTYRKRIETVVSRLGHLR